MHAAPGEAFADALAHKRSVFGDSPAENYGIHAVDGGELGSNVLPRAKTEYFEGESYAVVGFEVLHEFPRVVGNAGEAQQTGVFVEQIFDAPDVHALVPDEIADNGGIDIARTHAHHQSFERGETHGGIDRAAIADGTAEQALSRCSVTMLARSGEVPVRCA